MSDIINAINKMLGTGKPTMRTTIMHTIVFDATGKYEKLEAFHRKVKETLSNQLDAILASAQLLPNGHVAYYNLTEVQANMVMASIDLNHLELISEVFVAAKNSKPMTAIDMFSMQANINQDYAKEQQRLALRQDKQDDLLEDLAEKTVQLDNKIRTAQSKEVKPPVGYASVKSLEISYAHMFPKTHIRGILQSAFGLPIIKTTTATKWVEGTAEWTDYTVYEVSTVGIVINSLIATGVRVNGLTGKPTQKVKSPLYDQPFKSPMK